MTLPRSAAVLGLGAVGGALVHELPKAGVPVLLQWRRADGALPSLVRKAALVLLAVPDGAVEGLCEQLAAAGLCGPKQLVVHLAGALPISPLQAAKRRGARTGSIHPLRAFVRGGPTSFRGAACGISGSSPAALEELRALAGALGLTPVDAPDGSRALYHAGAVLSAGGEVALFAAATQAFQLATHCTEAEARRALLPLTLNALEKLSDRTPAEALTGPVARGDAATIRAHRAALPAGLRGLYDALSKVALELARLGKRSTPAALDAVETAINARTTSGTTRPSKPTAAPGSPGRRSGSSPPRPRPPAPKSPAASSPRSGRSGPPRAPPPPGRGPRRRR